MPLRGPDDLTTPLRSARDCLIRAFNALSAVDAADIDVDVKRAAESVARDWTDVYAAATVKQDVAVWIYQCWVELRISDPVSQLHYPVLTESRDVAAGWVRSCVALRCYPTCRPFCAPSTGFWPQVGGKKKTSTDSPLLFSMCRSLDGSPRTSSLSTRIFGS